MSITKYYELALRIQEQGGTGSVPALYAQAVDLQDEILAQYGLPPSRRFIRILQSILRYRKPNKQVLSKTTQRLEEAAAEYLLSTPLPDETFLTQARAQRLNALDILPEMGMPIQEYMVFVYNHYCSHPKTNAKQVIKEFRLLKEPHVLQDIARIKEDGGHRNDPRYIQLKAQGFQFLDAYLKAQKEILKRLPGRQELETGDMDKDHMTQKEMEQQLRELMDKAAASYLQYLQLRSHGMKDAQARQHVGLEDEVFYHIALYTFMLQKE